MKADELRKLLRARPFRPFVVHLPSGDSVSVFHHDFAYLSPDGRTLFTYQKDYSFDMIDVMLIQSVSMAPEEPPPPPPNANGPTNPSA